MTENEKRIIAKKVRGTLIRAGSSFSSDRIACYSHAIDTESSELSAWAMEQIIENARAAAQMRSPLCDDTGIPHLIFEIGKDRELSGELLEAVYEGVKEGLRDLPGRPMAIRGDARERIDQSGGLDERSEAVEPAPLQLLFSDDPDRLRLIVLMQGGGPEIRAKTYRVFHRHSAETVLNEIVSWATEAVAQLGCSPCTLAVGIGRSHYEASSLMLQAMAEGDCGVQNEWETRITEAVNQSGTGAMGLGGDHSVLATFLKVGPQRASGVRIVCMRPCCCFEPRRCEVDL